MFRFVVGVTLLSGTVASAVPTRNVEQSSERHLVEQAFAQAEAELMKAGPVDPDWNKGGVDLYAILATSPGGVAHNVLLGIDKDKSVTVTVVGAASLDELIPRTWQRSTIIGPNYAGPASGPVEFGSVDGQFRFASWGAHRKVGDAFCSAGVAGGVRLSDPNLPKTDIPSHVADLVIEHVIDRAGKVEVCWRFDPADGGYSARYFLPDGRSLPAMSEDGEIFQIAPSAPLDQLLSQARE
jgi:hypothetical protein